MRHYADSSEKSHVCLRCSVVNALATLRLHYQLFSVMRSSLRSERKRSELLFVGNVRFRAAFFMFSYFISACCAFLFVIKKFAVPTLSQKGTLGAPARL